MTDDRRALPAIPLTTRSRATRRQRQFPTSTPQTASSTSFHDEEGHYTDIHWNTAGDAARIPRSGPSTVDDPDHYSYIDLDQVTGNDRVVEQRHGSTCYQGLNPVELDQPRAPDHYTGIRTDQPQSKIDAEGYLMPVEISENESQQLPSSHDHSPLRSEEDSVVCTSEQRQGEVGRRGNEGFDPEELRRPPTSRSGVGTDARSPPDVSDVHSYLELVAYSGVGN